MIFDMQNTPKFDIARRAFYHLYFFAYKSGEFSIEAQKQGNRKKAEAAKIVNKMYTQQAKEAWEAMDRLRPPRPAIIDTDVAIEEDMHLLVPEIFLNDHS